MSLLRRLRQLLRHLALQSIWLGQCGKTADLHCGGCWRSHRQDHWLETFLRLVCYWTLIRLDGDERVGEGWELMKIRGIPLRVHPSWFVILLLFTWISQNQVSAAAESSLPAWISWGLGLITALLLFLSVLLHELGHSLVALREGVKVRSITLFFLGGVTSVEREALHRWPL